MCRLREKGAAPRGLHPLPSPHALPRVTVPFHSTRKFKSEHGGIFWKGAKMELRRWGSVWKEQMDYFFPLLANEDRPQSPLLMKPPPSAHAHLGGGRVLKARPPQLRQCALQRTPSDEQPSANPRSRPPTQRSRNHGGSGSSLS